MFSNSILYISDNGDGCSVIADKLRPLDLSVIEAVSQEQAEESLRSRAHSVFIYRCDTINDRSLEILHFIRRHQLPCKVVVSSRQGTVEDAVRVIKAGASDYILGEQFDSRIIESVLRCLSRFDDVEQSNSTADRSGKEEPEPVLVGQSAAIREIRSAVNLVAKSQTTILITGESGTGKEVISRLLHRQSNRKTRPFIALNCATLPKDVIENELFGHEKGAFTGALVKKPGCFEMADQGTLFFDEIAEMSLETQAKLLRAIETQKFRRLGGKEEVHVDVRLVAATNKNIALALKAKELREDLYYRLSVIEIFIPPLRERKEDIAPLVEYFLSVFSKKYGKQKQRFDDKSMNLMSNYDWPGNVREIRNVVERAFVLCSHDSIGTQYLPERIKSRHVSQVLINIPLGSSSQEAERILILQTLASAGNNKAKAAKILGLSRKTLHNKLASWSQP